MDKDKYLGMTVNERLYVSGLMDDFDKAVRKKDTESAIRILEKVELNKQSIIPILENVGLKIS